MKVESSIKENCVSTTTQPITDTEECIKAICEWNNISINDFRNITWDYALVGVDNDNNRIYVKWDTIINPIGVYLMSAYDWKDIVFEKWNDKFFWTIKVRTERTKYQLWDKIIDIPYRVKAENEDTEESMIIFPKKQDFIQPRMKWMYVVNTWWAERQRIEKEIMAKLIELAMVRGWNEIVSTQNAFENLKETLKKKGIDIDANSDWCIYIDIPRRKVRDTAENDNEYLAPPIEVRIDFENKSVGSLGYSSHWFGTPTSWGNPCWWNWSGDIKHCLTDCNLQSLINLIVSWAYGYNSEDTTRQHTDRHPLAKLRDYVRYYLERKTRDDEDIKKHIQGMREHLQEIKEDLEIDNYIEDNASIKDFLSYLEWKNETAE